MNSKDKIKLLFDKPEDVFKMFHIDEETGYIYKKDFWDRGIKKRVGRLTPDKEYFRINVNCPHLTHIFKRGYIDVTAHRLIHYAFTGELPEKVDHIDKDIKYPDAPSNLRKSDSFNNRLNTNKIKRKIISEEERIDNRPSAFRERRLKEFRGIYYAYKYYWSIYNGEIINENGFISPLIAVSFRNNYLKEIYIGKYGSLKGFPENALDELDENELFLEQMLQESIEKTSEYKQRQEEIKIEMKKRSRETLKRKAQIPLIKIEDDPFECIGKYD